MLKTILTSPTHPEYGSVTVSFPIPEEDYDHSISLLEGLGIGDILAQDCRVVELESPYPVLDRLKGAAVNVDELDYLAKRLDSFCEGEGSQFLAMAHKLDLSDIKDLINLTFCCQQATVITDFSNLEQIGRDHCMNINFGVMSTEEYGRHMIRESGRYEYDANLEEFYDYRLYGEQRVRQEGGSFNECGYVSYHGVMPLEELMREDPVEQYQREAGMQML